MNPGHPGPIAAEGRFEWPLKGEVLSRFGAPVGSREGEPSYGLIIRGMPGRIVTAAKSGRVSTLTKFPLLAKVVILEHTDGFSSLYGNLDEILVKHGTWVRQGETIGIARASGPSGGCELDFRLWIGNRFVDPSPYLLR
jgi:septal ring factor EnvC (AmiA/AmiB activator)